MANDALKKLNITEILPIKDLYNTLKLTNQPVQITISNNEDFKITDNFIIKFNVENRIFLNREYIINSPGIYKITFNDIVDIFEFTNITESACHKPPSMLNLNSNQQFNNIINDFISRHKIYEQLKSHPKIGVLAYGPPGNGKSATILSILNNFLKESVTLLLDFQSYSTAIFNEMMTSLKTSDNIKYIFLIIEDLGSSGIGNDNAEDISSLLELLDNSKSILKLPTVIIATSNYPELIKKNIINRPGRIDYFVNFPNPSFEDKKRLLNFFGEDAELLCQDEEFVKLLKYNNFSISHIKEAVIRSKLKNIHIKEALVELKKMCELVEDDFSYNKMGIL